MKVLSHVKENVQCRFNQYRGTGSVTKQKRSEKSPVSKKSFNQINCLQLEVLTLVKAWH